MAYRLRIAEDGVPDSVRACAREQLGGAVAQVERAGEDPVDAVHEARKHLKKARALLRLTRPALGAKAYRRENGALRDAGLALSGARDADVRAETAAKLADHAAGQLPAEVFAQLCDALAAEALAGRRDGSLERAAVLDALRDAEARVDDWPLKRCDWDDLLAGAARAYARGRTAFALARADPTPEHVHAWRKRAKDLWYHQRLLAPAWPGLLGAQAGEAHVLTELLGDDHDLAVLAERLAPDAPPLGPVADAHRAELRALAERRRGELRVVAVRLGRRLYAERPKLFARRLARYVRAALEEQREPDATD